MAMGWGSSAVPRRCARAGPTVTTVQGRPGVFFRKQKLLFLNFTFIYLFLSLMQGYPLLM